MSEDTVSEYRVKVVVRNNLILNLIEEKGYTSIPKFAEDHGLRYKELYTFISLKKAPLTSGGEFCLLAKQLMEIFGAAPNDLWTDEQLTMKLNKNYSEREMDSDDLAQLAQNLPTITGQITYDSPEEALYKKETVRVTSDMLKGLTPKERKTIILRWGINGSEKHTLDEVGTIFDVSRERVRQIEAKALRKLQERGKRGKNKAPERIDVGRVALAVQNTGAAQEDRQMVREAAVKTFTQSPSLRRLT